MLFENYHLRTSGALQGYWELFRRVRPLSPGSRRANETCDTVTPIDSPLIPVPPSLPLTCATNLHSRSRLDVDGHLELLDVLYSQEDLAETTQPGSVKTTPEKCVMINTVGQCRQSTNYLPDTNGKP
jgi:hypothetical protein